eukprot:TRINITY_DN2318_c0_g1_i9.p1 TRINITY_DN2318_c0_g1~~TRINITY_DN2318_c0_g1_i9.p1  ORF type:complete len:220 (+),score=12.86 TRINITY_DN2318_c0_g1_i9:281-940(+)
MEVFPRIMSTPVMSITLRIPNEEETHAFPAEGFHTIGDLMFSIQDSGICPVAEQRLCHKGRVLAEDEPIEVLKGLPVVILARKSSPVRPPRYGGDPVARLPVPSTSLSDLSRPLPRTSSNQSLASNESVERTCRICLDGDGRLISPCLCRGSSKFVHVECLNAWRAQSASNVSFFQCDVCGYRYNLQRTHWASVLQSDQVQLAATVFVILLVGTVGGPR